MLGLPACAAGWAINCFLLGRGHEAGVAPASTSQRRSVRRALFLAVLVRAGGGPGRARRFLRGGFLRHRAAGAALALGGVGLATLGVLGRLGHLISLSPPWIGGQGHSMFESECACVGAVWRSP